MVMFTFSKSIWHIDDVAWLISQQFTRSLLVDFLFLGKIDETFTNVGNILC